MVGVVVGVQFFGGEGLLGIGLKVGGLFYLFWLVGRLQVELLEIGGMVVSDVVFICLVDWLIVVGYYEVVGQCVCYVELMLCYIWFDLVGLMGECNILYFVLCGMLLCLVDYEEVFFGQMVVVLVVGNMIVVVDLVFG